MRILSADAADLEIAAAALRDGRLVAFPTETVYGLGADAFNPEALARVFEAKGRPRFDPLIVHIAAPEAADRVARPELLSAENRARFELLSAKLWPGPLTLVLPKRTELPELATSGLPTVAVRLPAHPAAQKLIALSTGAIAAPSANPFGRLSPTCAGHVRDQLGEKVDFIIDGGFSRVGVESTVLDLCTDPPRILRPGGVSRETLESLTGPLSRDPGNSTTVATPNSPGMLKSHYAPRTPLVLHGQAEMLLLPREKNTGYLFFSDYSRGLWLASQPAPQSPPGVQAEILRAPEVRVLSPSGNATAAAANFFLALHELDALGLLRIHAERAPPGGLGPAINDRLERASY
ncbi:MAG: threonylcarbamoyl-AMP synthase [Spirochaetaceae bacterium]|jgi:L-threonylcarbamoyladenylate synthase|nr:threonylcarbamoyl-AMP synthase [Spirochaetaceae bacterium]